MDTKHEHESEVAEELQSKANQREEGHLGAERHEQEDLNQGMQTGTHDAFHSGIKWGSLYRIKENAASPKKGFDVERKDSEGNS